MAEVSKTGVWIDQVTGQVVTDPPERGVQLVAPGYPIDDRAERVIAAAKAASPEAAPKRSTVETADAPAATETADAPASRTRKQKR